MSEGEFTIIDALRAMDYEPETRFDWSLGQLVQKRYHQIYGSQPRKDLRPKTFTKGVHCFAIYPEVFRPEADRIIRREAIAAERARSQQTTFNFES